MKEATRLATPADLPRMLELARAMHAESLYSKLPLSEEKVAGKILGLLASPDGIVAISPAGMMLGFVAAYWFSPARYAAELLLYVLPEARGGGEAKELLGLWQSRARELGAVDCRLGNSAGVNTEQVGKFFQRQGYTLVGGNFVKEL